MPDLLLLGPAAALTATTAYATAVSATEPGPPGEPFGLHVPGAVRTDLLLGLGSGIAAPWPMPVVAAVVAARAEPGSPGAARTVAVIGTLLFFGTVVEPATWGRRPESDRAWATVPLHLLSAAAMVAAGTYRLHQRR